MATLCLATPFRVFAQSAEGGGTIDWEYSRLIKEEEERQNPRYQTERLISGVAALTIGLYGYHNDDRGVVTRGIYSLTQTAGILMMSDAILGSNQQSLLLKTNRLLIRRDTLDRERFKRVAVALDRQRRAAEVKQRAYTSAVLASIYAYNGYRETEQSTGLRSAFYFLSFNFALISTSSFYRLWSDTAPPAVAGLVDPVDVALLPYPTITYRF